MEAETGLAISESGKLLQMAIEKDLDVDKLKALMDLRDREDRRKAEREFEDCFAAMQRDYIPAYKSKDVSTGTGKIAYSYCPLPKILAVYAPILAKHGFSYRWEESEIEGKLEKKTTCFLSGHGFTRQASISLPYGATNNLINPIQARGATSEYGRRYTFMNVTGCIVADDTDTDGIIEPAPGATATEAPTTEAPKNGDQKYTVFDEPIPADYKEKKAEYRAKGYGCKRIGKDWKWLRYGTVEQSAPAPTTAAASAPASQPAPAEIPAKVDTKLSEATVKDGIEMMNEMGYSPVIQKARIAWGNSAGSKTFLDNIEKDYENFLSKKSAAAPDVELPF
jgi:hypothetical protein